MWNHPSSRFFIAVFTLLILTAGCSGSSTPIPTFTPPDAPPTATPPPTATQPIQSEATSVEALHASLPTDRGEYFSASGVCSVCHNNMVDESGADVSIDRLWRASLEANAGRDPFWQAALQAAVLDHPQQQAELEAGCTLCHMPMAQFTSVQSGEAPRALADGYLDPSNPLHSLALDGVSCTLCHQIQDDDLGFATSFNGGFVINPDLPEGERPAFGPFAVEDSLSFLMQSATGFVPTQSLHITRPELCAACHTYYVDLGEGQDSFPLLMTYLEWFESDFRGSASCQTCHMPEPVGGVRIAASSDRRRSPLGQHSFQGGNAYVLKLLQRYGDELEVTAAREHFEEAIERNLALLQSDAAVVRLNDVQLSGSRVRATVEIKNLVGHKFPSGFPSRRLWLHITVESETQGVVFESGGYAADGSIIGNDGEADNQLFEPHYFAITAEDQVQIYETVLRDNEGSLTTSIVDAVEYAKDNRLFPDGLQPARGFVDLAVYGRASEDEDFLAGGDSVDLILKLADSNGPYTLTVELLFQAVASTWARSYENYGSTLTDRFVDYYAAMPDTPVVIASESVSLGTP